jgi:hypothetical protein
VLVAGASATAHLMVAQRGTLNIVGDGAFMVLSLPVSALQGVDDDGDGRLSMAEGQAHADAIEAQVRRGVQLADARGPLPLQGLMINLSPPDGAPAQPAPQIVVMGRFALGPATEGLRMSLSLFGTGAAEQTQQITVTRGDSKQHMVLARGRASRDVLPPPSAVFLDHVLLGAGHVLGGLDHLIFLLVVLSTGLRPRMFVLALTCFTAGHAAALLASVWSGHVLPARLVEPAIAATIIGMALFDRWSRSRAQPLPSAVRLALVFACALVHGLGLAGALTDLRMDTPNLVWSLAGFNLGVEAGQLAVALPAAAALAAIGRLQCVQTRAWPMRLASIGAVGVGAIWLVLRLITPA